MTSFGTRLQEERNRLNITQDTFGQLGGVRRNAQSEYENGGAFPKADYLIRLAAKEVDVVYLIYGERIAFTAAQQEKELIEVLVSLTPAQQALGFIMLNSIKRAGAGSQTGADARTTWRGARLLEQFLEMGDADQSILEAAAQGLVRAKAAD
jgi:transcriptional regulator with XRE-family HTH domain